MGAGLVPDHGKQGLSVCACVPIVCFRITDTGQILLLTSCCSGLLSVMRLLFIIYPDIPTGSQVRRVRPQCATSSYTKMLPFWWWRTSSLERWIFQQIFELEQIFVCLDVYVSL